MIDVIKFQSCGATLEGRVYHPAITPQVNALVTILTGDSPNGLKSKTWPPMINVLNDRHITVFAFDFLSQGFSGGNRASLTLSVGCQNLIDSQAALAIHLDLSSYSVGFLGSSFGGTVILSEHGRVGKHHAIALKSPASFLAEAYELEHGFPAGMDEWRKSNVSSVTGLPYRAYLEALEQNIYSRIASITVPILIVHGTSDSMVPITQSRRLCHLLGQRSRMVELPGVNHDYKHPGAQDVMQDYIVRFFSDILLTEGRNNTRGRQ